MPARVLIFDLDETLLADALSTQAALLATVEAANLGQRTDARELAGTALRHARRLWEQGPAYEYADAIGISASEGLWGSFAGDDPGLRRLAAWAPEYYHGAWSAALAEHGLADDVSGDTLAAQLAARFREERLATQLLFPDTLPALGRLRQTYRLAILTNGAPDIQRAKIDGASLAPYFELIVVSGEVGAGKPDPRIYAQTLAVLDVVPSDAVMIGDSLANDVRGPQQAGMRGIWLARDGGTGHELGRGVVRGSHSARGVAPDATIRALDELPGVL